MILECCGALFVALGVSFVCHLIVLGAKNRLKYQFFQLNAPGLKIVKSPSLFGGHTNQIIHDRRNWTRVDKLIKKHGPTIGLYYAARPTVLTVDFDFIRIFALDEHDNANRTGPIKAAEKDSTLFDVDHHWPELQKVNAPALAVKSPNIHSNVGRIVNKLVCLIERRLGEAKTGRQENFIEADAEDICRRYALALVFSNFYKQDNKVNFCSEKSARMIDRLFIIMVCFFLKACAIFPLIKPCVDWLAMNFDDQGAIRNRIMDYIKQQTRNHFEATKRAQKISSGRKISQLGKIVEDRGQFEKVDEIAPSDGSKLSRNMVDYIIDQYHEGELTWSEYFNSTLFLFFAADKTASDGLARLLYNLAGHPDVQEKLYRSILDAGTDSEYLAWVIHETLRLHPPAPIGCSRVIKRDIQTKHGLVPAGTFVVTPAYSIGRLKEYWGPDADDFRPERWAHAKSFHPVQYLAFGGGRRACPGKELALMEIKMLLDVLVRRYSFVRSALHPVEHSKLVNSPIFTFLASNEPTYVRILRRY